MVYQDINVRSNLLTKVLRSGWRSFRRRSWSSAFPEALSLHYQRWALPFHRWRPSRWSCWGTFWHYHTFKHRSQTRHRRFLFLCFSWQRTSPLWCQVKWRWTRWRRTSPGSSDTPCMPGCLWAVSICLGIVWWSCFLRSQCFPHNYHEINQHKSVLWN